LDLYFELASADPDKKFKSWQSENGQYGVAAGCEKSNDDCKQFKEAFGGDNVNKVAREGCERFSCQKCKQQNK